MCSEEVKENPGPKEEIVHSLHLVPIPSEENKNLFLSVLLPP